MFIYGIIKNHQKRPSPTGHPNSKRRRFQANNGVSDVLFRISFILAPLVNSLPFIAVQQFLLVNNDPNGINHMTLFQSCLFKRVGEISV